MRSAAGTPRVSAARATRKWRACAAARRSGLALSWIVSLAMVGPWSGATALSPSTIATRTKAHVQLLGDDLRQRRSDARAEIDVAAEGRHLAGSRDDDERFERLRLRAVHGRAGALGTDDGERSWLLQIVRATEPLRLEHRHARASVAASLTAATISTCAPQRQRLKRSASRISASVGSGLASISARAVMIMPLRQ